MTASKAPRGPARELIRATLDLPRDYRVGKAEARQAVLMALMGRCDAGALAKFLHDHMPRKLARDLKALVEENHVTVRNGQSLIDIPLHVSADDCSSDETLSEHVMLLRGWESTFASVAHNRIASRHKDKLRRAILYGKTAAGHDPHALASKAAQCVSQLTGVDPRYKSAGIEQLRREFISHIDALLDDRLQLVFEPGKPAVLCISERADRSDDSAQPLRRIQSAGDFKSALTGLLRQAHSRTRESLDRTGGAGAFERQVLRLIADHLRNYIDRPGDNDFLEHLASQFVPPGTSTNDAERRELCWKVGVRRQLADLAEVYFGKRVDMLSSADAYPPYPPDPASPRDATHILHFILDTLWSMKRAIRAEVERSPDTFHVPVAVDDHVFSLTPGSLIDDWDAPQNAGQWIEDRLKSAGRAHALNARTEPPLEQLLAQVAALIDRDKDGYGLPQVPKSRLIDTVKAVSAVERDGDGAYTLQGVYAALSEPGVYRPTPDGERFLDCLATAILQVEPPPAIQIADTHMPSPSRWGDTDRLGVLYNPFRDTINIHCMDDANDGHAPVAQAWLEHPWHIMTTPLHDADDAQAVRHE